MIITGQVPRPGYAQGYEVFPKHFSRLSNPLKEVSMEMPVLKFHIHEVQGHF